MSREYDIFYDASDSWVQHRGFHTTCTVAPTITASPQVITITTVDALRVLHPGNVVAIIDTTPTNGTTVAAYFEVTKEYASGTSLEVRPLISSADILDTTTMSTIVGHPFQNDAIVSTVSDILPVYVEAARTIIDLTEAPNKTYNYVVFGCGWLNSTLTQVSTVDSYTADAHLKICKPNEIFAAAGVNGASSNDVYTPNKVTFTVGSTRQADLGEAWAELYELDGGECYNAQVGGIIALSGGQRYDLSFQFRGATGDTDDAQAVQMHQPRLIAFRYDPNAATTFQSDAVNTDATAAVANGYNENLNTVTVSSQFYLDKPSGEAYPASEELMTIGVCLCNSDYITAHESNAGVDNTWTINGNTPRGTKFIPKAATDEIATSAIQINLFAAEDNETRILQAYGSGTYNKASYGFLITFLPSILNVGLTGGPRSPSSEEGETVTATGVTGEEWTPFDYPDAVDPESRDVAYYSNFLSTAILTDLDVTGNTAWMQPWVFRLDGGTAVGNQVQTVAPFGRAGYFGNGTHTSNTRVLLSFFTRVKTESPVTKDAGASPPVGRYIGARFKMTNGSGGQIVGTADIYNQEPEVLAMKEVAFPDIPLDAATTVIAELLPGIGLKAWAKTDETPGSSSTVGYTWKTTLSDPPEIVSVFRGITELTESAVSSPGDASNLGGKDYWHYTKSTGVLRIQIDSIYSPYQASANIYAITPIRVALNHEDIATVDTYYPYDGRMIGLPGSTKSVSSSGAKFQSSYSLGKISLAAADGEYDEKFFDYIWEGRDANVWIGNSSISSNIEDFKLVSRGTMALPSRTIDKFEVTLLDKKVDLTRQLHNTTITHLAGPLPGTSLKYQELPVVYGSVKRVPAYRTFSEGTDAGVAGYYRVSANAITSISKIYASTDAEKFEIGSTTGVFFDPEAGQLAIRNDIIAGLGSSDADNYTYDQKDVPDTIYVDAIGKADYVSGSVTKSYRSPGEIAYDVLSTDQIVLHPDIAASGVTFTQILSSDVWWVSTGALDPGAIPWSVWVDGSKLTYDAGAGLGPTAGEFGVVSSLYGYFLYVFSTSDPTGKVFWDQLGNDPKTVEAPISTGNLDKASFQLYDSKKRHRYREVTGQGYRQTNEPVDVGFLIQPGETVAAVLNKICNATFGYWKSNQGGRIAIAAGDFAEGNLVVNGSAELPGVSASDLGAYPWHGVGGTTIERKQATVSETVGTRIPAFTGAYTLAVTSLNATGYAYQDVPLPKAGKYVLTCVAQGVSWGGVNSTGSVTPSVELANGEILTFDQVITPDVKTLSVGDAAWERVTNDFEVEFGNAGIGRVRFNVLNVLTTTTALDMVELFPVACILEDDNTIINSLNWAPEIYYGIGCPFDVREKARAGGQREQRTRIFIDIEAKEGSLGTYDVSTVKDLVESAGVATLSDGMAVEEYDADGIAAAAVSYYSRQRATMDVTVLGLTKIPSVGDYVYAKSLSRLGTGPDEYPIWRIMSVSFDAANPKTTKLSLEQPVDPVNDRMATSYHYYG